MRQFKSFAALKIRDSGAFEAAVKAGILALKLKRGETKAGHGEGSVKVILYRLAANAVIAIAKGATALRTRSGAILAKEQPRTTTGPNGETYHFDIKPVYKERLLKSFDDVGLVLRRLPEIEAFERRQYARMPGLA